MSVRAQFASLVAEWTLNGPGTNPNPIIVENTITTGLIGQLQWCRDTNTSTQPPPYVSVGILPSGKQSNSQALCFTDTNTKINTVEVVDLMQVLELPKLTVEVWVKPQSGTNNKQQEYLFSKSCLGSPQAIQYAAYGLSTGPDNQGIFFYIKPKASSTTTLVFSSDGRPKAASQWEDNWHLVAGIYDGYAVSISVDGTLADPSTSNNSGIDYMGYGSTNCYIGGCGFGCGPGREFLGFNGDLALVRVWYGVLSATELSDHYGQGF